MKRRKISGRKWKGEREKERKREKREKGESEKALDIEETCRIKWKEKEGWSEL